MKFKRRGMIRMRMPAIRATMAGTCAAVTTIAMSPACRESNRGVELSCSLYSGIADARRLHEFRIPHKNCPKMPRMRQLTSGTTPKATHWPGAQAFEQWKQAVGEGVKPCERYS